MGFDYDLINFEIPLKNVRYVKYKLPAVRRELGVESLGCTGGGRTQLLYWCWSPAPRKHLDHWTRRHYRPRHHIWAVRQKIDAAGVTGPPRIILYEVRRDKDGTWSVYGYFEQLFSDDAMDCPLECLERAPLVFNENWRQLLRSHVAMRAYLPRPEARLEQTNLWLPRRLYER